MIHRSLSFAALAAALASALATQEETTTSIDVRVDRRTELMGIVFRLAGNPEYQQAKLDGYAAAVDEWFGKFAKEPVVARAKKLRQTRGVSYDAPMSLAVHLAEGDDWRLQVPLAPWPDALDSRWTESDVKAFVRELGRFASKTRFDRFMTEHRELYDTACARLRAVIDEHARLGWFDEFFGRRPGARFTLCLGLLNGGANYGPRVRHKDGTEELFSVLGVWLVDDEGLPRFDASVVSTIVHEFCHSYCNPLIDAHLDALRPAGEALWPHVAEGMKAQAYGNWSTMLRESLVRACVVRYEFATMGDRGRREEIAAQKQREFLWIEELSDLLGDYEADREHFATLEDFMPQVVAAFADYPAALETELARTPKIASMVPANGQEDVDPATKAIVVTFDRPMLDGAWAVVGGGPKFPTMTGRPSYDESRTVLTIPVELKPDWSYELWLNRGKFDSFQSAERVKLRPVHVTFSTR